MEQHCRWHSDCLRFQFVHLDPRCMTSLQLHHRVVTYWMEAAIL